MTYHIVIIIMMMLHADNNTAPTNNIINHYNDDNFTHDINVLNNNEEKISMKEGKLDDDFELIDTTRNIKHLNSYNISNNENDDKDNILDNENREGLYLCEVMTNSNELKRINDNYFKYHSNLASNLLRTSSSGS
ncbi:hypothetical protein PFDG_05245, partial [Plasmodium falciparum Dd2]